MRRARLLIVPLVVAAVLVSTALPAAAATTVSLRYWPTQHFTALSGGASLRTWDTGMISLGLRNDLPSNWGVSFNLDWGSQGNYNPASTWATGVSGNDSIWNINLHRNFPTATGAFSIFLGYESAGFGTVFPGVAAAQTGRYTGFRAGADVRHMSGPWSFMAWAAVGIGGTTTWDWPGVVATPQSTGGYFNEYGATLGFTTSSGWTIDGGYRVVTFGGGATAGFLQADHRWQGWMIGISRTLP